MDFKDKNIAVIGEGVEGRSSFEYLKKHGAKVTLFDKKQGPDYLSSIHNFDLVVRSPGVKLSLLEGVKKEKLTSQTKLFFDLCPGQIIGVTGTKGKGTTSALIFEMLKAQGLDVYLGGNIGVPPFEFLDKLKKGSIVVLELSSFQLMDLEKSPHIAVMLMVTSEHLDYHKSVEEYIDAKRNILKYQTANDFTILNRDYPATNESDIFTMGKVYTVSRERESFDEGCFVRYGKIILRINKSEEEIIEEEEILLPGKHNLENICAAVTAAYLAGVSIVNIKKVLMSFKGLEHRLELIATIGGVKFYDDSFSTTPETAIAAIESFRSPEILIMGGSSKNSDFTELGQVISKTSNIKAIIGIGVEWEKIKSKIQNPLHEIIFIEGADNMEKIIKAVIKIAYPGDVVLLSPACASFGMFKNYKVRGEQFKAEVIKLKV